MQHDNPAQIKLINFIIFILFEIVMQIKALVMLKGSYKVIPLVQVEKTKTTNAMLMMKTYCSILVTVLSACKLIRFY